MGVRVSKRFRDLYALPDRVTDAFLICDPVVVANGIVHTERHGLAGTNGIAHAECYRLDVANRVDHAVAVTHIDTKRVELGNAIVHRVADDNGVSHAVTL